VPAIKIDGRRLQGSLEIPRALKELRLEPRLYPADLLLRKRVEEAEAWGERVFQSVPRRLAWWAIRRDRSSLRSFAQGSRLGVPLGLAVRTASPIVWWEVRTHGAYDDQVRGDLAALPGALARIDAWIDEGVLGGELPNAADFQIATSVRLLMCLDDLRPIVEVRPAGAFADRVVQHFPGRIPQVIPPDWIHA
jgi:glutathione S-transferase